MIKTLPASNIFKTQDAKQITIISIIALLIGHLMINLFFQNVLLNLIGLLIASLFIYHNTLEKNDLFSFVMVMYFCSTFPYLPAKGGAFNLVSFVCTGLYLLIKNKFPSEKKIKDVWFKLLLGLFILSSILGWLVNYTGKNYDFYYSFISFFGMIFLLLLASRIEITSDRIKIFLQINIVLILWSFIASINKYLHIVDFKTPMMPVYGTAGEYFEGGGLIGSSPLYGEHSLILLMLFTVFLVFRMQRINLKRSTLLIAAMIAYVNVFMSISRSVFLLSIAGLVLVFLFQFKIDKININRTVQHLSILLIFAFSTFFLIQASGLDYVFKRMEQIQEVTKKAGGISIERILDGSAFNRAVVFEAVEKRYASKDSWLIGYGWGLPQNNREAFFVNPRIKLNSAHSQIFAMLFLFGWIGSFAYWGLLIRIIFKAFKISSSNKIEKTNRMFAYFFMISFSLFIFNEIKADSIYLPAYFSVTIIWMGLAFSVFNSTNKNQIFSLK